jgi:peptidoglycan/LPS O-acetylase OafA/YrhL
VKHGVSQNRFQSLDILRGLSCIFIVIFHSVIICFPFPQELRPSTALVTLNACKHLHVGVPFFFVISGYCINNSWDRISALDSPLEFFRKRFLRIFPPFWCAWLLAGVSLLILKNLNLLHLADGSEHTAITPFDLDRFQLLGNLTLTETWRPLVIGDSHSEMNMLGQMWTLCYEEQFYLLCFVLLLLPRTWFLPLTSAVAVYIAFGTVGLRFSSSHSLTVAYQWIHSYCPILKGTFLDAPFLDFYAGITAYTCIRDGILRPKSLITIVCLTFVTIVMILEFRLGTRPSLGDRLVAIGFAVFLVALHPFDHVFAGCRLFGPLKWCGTRCYSLYLTHGLVVTVIVSALVHAGVSSPATILFVGIPLCLIAAVLTCAGFYNSIERGWVFSKLILLARSCVFRR